MMPNRPISARVRLTRPSHVVAERGRAQLVRSNDGQVLAETLWIADDFLSRLQGLIGRDDFGARDALWLRPCRSVHTIGMRFPIDVLYIDVENRIIDLAAGVPSGKLRWAPRECRSVIELHAGRSNDLNLRTGDGMEAGYLE